jgi:hypothetical protein
MPNTIAIRGPAKLTLAELFSQHGKWWSFYDLAGKKFEDLGQQGAETHISSLADLGNGIALAGTRPSGKIFRSTDYGLTWVDLGQQGAETYILSLADLGNGIALAGTGLNGKIFRSPKPPNW